MTDYLEELGNAYTAVVADALDRLGFREQILDPAIRPLRSGVCVAGRAVPVVIDATTEIPDEPYTGEMDALDSLGPGDVPLLSVDPKSRAAVWGELFSCAALGRGARGAIVDGFTRDARQISELGFPLFCRGFSPLDTLGRAQVRSFGVPAVVGGVRVEPGDYVIGDEDGIVAVPGAVIEDVLGIVREKASTELDARADLLAGAGVRDIWAKYGVF
jgi:4-hydroxy-4-methyl-2-oxoglutarate aldolase